jgi:hypothetical protein
MDSQKCMLTGCLSEAAPQVKIEEGELGAGAEEGRVIPQECLLKCLACSQAQSPSWVQLRVTKLLLAFPSTSHLHFPASILPTVPFIRQTQ